MPVSIVPHALLNGIGEVELIFNGDKALRRRRVGLDGLDLGRDPFDFHSVLSCRIGYRHGDHAVLPIEVAPVVVIEVLVERFAVFSAEVPLTADWHELAGREDVVIAINGGQHRSGNVQAGLGAVAGWNVEVRMPSDGHGLGFGTDILRYDHGVYSVGGQGDGELQISLREPMAAEVAGMNYARDFLAAVNVFLGYIFGLRLQDQAMHGVLFGTGQLADIVRRQRDGVALPLGGESLAIRGKLAANAVRVGNKKC